MNSILHRTTRPMLTKNQREEIVLRNYVNAIKGYFFFIIIALFGITFKPLTVPQTSTC